jgi:putative serine protease PepD
MTDREHPQPPDRQQPSWPLAAETQRRPDRDDRPVTDQPHAAPAGAGHPGAVPAGAAQAGAAPARPEFAAPPFPPAPPVQGPRPPQSIPAQQAPHTQPAAHAPQGQPGAPAPQGQPGAPATPAYGYTQTAGYGHQSQQRQAGQQSQYGQASQYGHAAQYGQASQTSQFARPGFSAGGYPTSTPGYGYQAYQQSTGPLGLPTQTPAGTAQGQRGGKRAAIAAGLLALMLGSGAVGGAVATQFDNDNTTSAAGTRAPAVSTAQTGSLADVVAAVSPSVVQINVTARAGSGTGSGVIIDASGTILTNAHVVSGASRIQVLLSTGKTVDATLVGADTNADIAVIQVDAGTLTAATIAGDGSVRVGDTVLAFGSPLGLEGSVSAGIVSSLDRQVEGRSSNLDGMIQTDAAINPGNSGGPLVNSAGQVIGVNTAIATTSEQGGNIGVGFAIPIQDAMKVANTLRSR